MPKYIIQKASRHYAGGCGYMGASCELAGVIPGRIYDDIEQAMFDRDLLSSVNPVGFTIEEYKRYEHKPYNPLDWEFSEEDSAELDKMEKEAHVRLDLMRKRD